VFPASIVFDTAGSSVLPRCILVVTVVVQPVTAAGAATFGFADSWHRRASPHHYRDLLNAPLCVRPIFYS